LGRSIRDHSPEMTRRILCHLPLAAAIVLLPFAASAQESAAAQQLGAAVKLLERGNATEAARALGPLPARLPVLADYPAFFLGQARFQLKDYANVPPALEPVFRVAQRSPLVGRAAVLAARSLLEINEPQSALTWLNRVPAALRAEPESSYFAAIAQEALGNPVAAVAAWKTIHYYFPVSTEARQAEAALERLRRSLGDRFPIVPAEARFARAGLLMKARQYDRSRAEYHEMAAELSGLDRERAMVRAAATLYEQRNTTAAISQLNALHLTEPDADAERWYWLAAAHRRADRDEGMESALAQLARRAPRSTWRRDALIIAGNRYLLDNSHQQYLPHYAACGDAFPNDPDGAYCHWKVVWRAWLDNRANAGDLLRQHLQNFSASEKAGAALFYLGRLAESENQFGAAKAYYEENVTRFPNYYHAVLARDRLKKPLIAHAAHHEATARFLSSVPFPSRDQNPSFSSDPETDARLRRGRLLAQASLERWAESEMRFGARHGANRWLLAMELASTAAARGAHAQALRYIKGTAPGYLYLPREAAPEKFWRLAFPFPYRTEITRYARQRNLDPYFVAALIRQESEFDPIVVSRAGAIGLMQIMPPTGRQLARQLRLGASTNARLRQPLFNLNLGTFYLRKLLDLRGGSVEETLAGYNAGASRVVRWKTWGSFDEPSEFVETIPFTETRNYVQIILRNQDVYEWLYSGTPVPAEPAARKPTPKKPAAKKPAPRKRAVRRK
jgi:soluble lytic murein transglycosylase